MVSHQQLHFTSLVGTLAGVAIGLELAEQEARAYVDETTCYLGEAQAFALFDPPKRGTEIFSLMRESSLAPEEDLARHFVTGTERAEDAPADPGGRASTA